MAFSCFISGEVYATNLLEDQFKPYTITATMSGMEYDENSQLVGTWEHYVEIIVSELHGSRPYLTYNDVSEGGVGSILINMGGSTYTQKEYWTHTNVETGTVDIITNNRVDYNHRIDYNPNTLSFLLKVNNIAVFCQETQLDKLTDFINAGESLTKEFIETLPNYGGDYIEANKPKYYINDTYNIGKGTYDGFTSTSNQTIHNIKLTCTDERAVALWLDRPNNTMTLFYAPNKILESYYNTGGPDTDNGIVPKWTVYYPYWSYGKVIGQTIAASVWNTNIPWFDTKSKAEGYINGTTSLDEAGNTDDVGGIITNQTGIAENITTFSDTYHTSIFSNQFACSKNALREIANALYDNTGTIWEDIKKGLEMYGSNPMEAVLDLSYYPFDITQVISSTVSQSYINMGSYRLTLNNSINRIVYSNGYIDCGTYPFAPTFKNWIDFSHISLEIYLPYIGLKQLDPCKYMNHNISVRYYIDFHTRGCTACVLADGILFDYYEGIIGISQPITGINYAEYATQTINTLLGTGTNVTNAAGNLIGNVANGMGTFGAVGAGIGGAATVMSTASQTSYNLSTNRPINHTSTKGSVGPDTGGHLPQYVFIRWGIPYDAEKNVSKYEPTNLRTLKGKPSNIGGSISSFSGYLEVSDVELTCGKATEEEKAEIVSLLKSGIRI